MPLENLELGSDLRVILLPCDDKISNKELRPLKVYIMRKEIQINFCSYMYKKKTLHSAISRFLSR